MEIVEIIGIDPSLRFTGVGKVVYNTETKAIKVTGCQVIQNKTTLKGTEAIAGMLDRIEGLASEPIYLEAKHVIVESPIMPFNPKFQASSMISVAHIAGGAAMAFGIDRVKLFRPTEWNKAKNKEKTHFNTQSKVGPWETWSWEVAARRKDHVEHVLDAVSMALWYLQEHYIEVCPTAPF
jgi:Holliday junction resolvasome RuvABC endonuclease subunit